MSAAKPWWCQDPTCRPVTNTPGCHRPDAPGQSGFCAGRMAAPVETIRHGERHLNDGHFCFRSPVRGVVMLEINAADCDNIARCALRLAVEYEPERPINLRWYTAREMDRTS